MESLKKAWGYIAAALIFLLGVALAIYFRTLGDKRAAANARADADEKNARRVIDQKRAELEKLQKDATENAAEIDRVKKDLATKKEELRGKFERRGLSAEEIAERFRRVRL